MTSELPKSSAPRTFPFDPLMRGARPPSAALGSAALAVDAANVDDARQGFVIDPDVPLPGSYSVKRVVRIDDIETGTGSKLTFKPNRPDYKFELGLTDGKTSATLREAPDPQRALEVWARYALAAGFPAAVVTDVVSAQAASTMPDPKASNAADMAARDSLSRQFADIERVLKSYLEGLKSKRLEIPVVSSNGTFGSRSLDLVKMESPPKEAIGTFYVVEEYRISSFATLYGLGKTVKSFTLLPGEETTIKVRTWRQRERSSSSKTSQTSSSGTSIVDSVDQSSIDRFSDQLQEAVSDKSTRASEENWRVEGQASGTCGFASASVKASGGGDYRSGQEDFASRTKTAINEHTQQASANRKNTVETSSASSTSLDLTSTERGEDENVVERKLRNVNLRRVLNFVFRELNQQYELIVHLVDVRIAFSTGEPTSWHVVPPSRLPGLVESVCEVNPDLSLEIGGVVDTSKPLAARVAANILQSISSVTAFDGTVVPVLECVLEATNGEKRVVKLGSGADFMLPTRRRRLEKGGQEDAFPSYPVDVSVSYRFGVKDAPKTNGQPDVPGVVVSMTETVMRTDSIVVEALLGFSDALDAFAFEAQDLGNEGKAAANELVQAEAEKLRVANALLGAITDPLERAKAYAAMFGPRLPEPASGSER